MNKRKIHSKYYKYPTSDERSAIAIKIPTYVRFNFESINIVESVFQLKRPLEEINQKNNLHYWNITLSNRLGKLKETHLYLLTHFDRGFKENHLDCNDKELVDHILFDYYVEIFYYFFFSTRDTLAQLLNIYFNFKMPDGKVKFESVLRLIKNEDIKSSLDSFYKVTKVANNYRNSLTHRFPINEKDYRTEFKTTSNGDKEISVKGGDYIESDKILLNINEISNNLSKLLLEIKSVIEKPS
ncbi:hypothetical protein JM658_16830 [Joostella atrarenae]|uniref:Cthe-2314-like HEPN domain-containing protein n=1 Tax=Joostella atrarenae TaxID=679257 RepID=A0ABS9J7U8_9FLAO|nr:Cthe_2314 family HEPN domain-containing protein [Joostella atrarenae]MCF8716489.1 hypothetical protein [Joostella atrarenae]